MPGLAANAKSSLGAVGREIQQQWLVECNYGKVLTGPWHKPGSYKIQRILLT